MAVHEAETRAESSYDDIPQTERVGRDHLRRASRPVIHDKTIVYGHHGIYIWLRRGLVEEGVGGSVYKRRHMGHRIAKGHDREVVIELIEGVGDASGCGIADLETVHELILQRAESGGVEEGVSRSELEEDFVFDPYVSEGQSPDVVLILRQELRYVLFILHFRSEEDKDCQRGQHEDPHKDPVRPEITVNRNEKP